jgi:hypothetical protein
LITKDDLKDWLSESERKKHAKKLEEFIDARIKANALSGKTTFHICTGEYTRDGSRKTPFYDLWNTEELSEGNRKIVQDNILKKYRDFGFDVQKTSVDCGWNNNYFALQFTEIQKVIAN